MSNSLLRFVSGDRLVRGEIVSLDSAWLEVAGRHRLPDCVRDRLGELCAASLLLAASLKFEGALVLQIHGDGPVALFVVECDAQGTFRATVKMREGQAAPEDAPLVELVNAHGRGRFVVTLDPRGTSSNRQPYQGIVPFEGDSVAGVLENYMQRSEQVPTRLWLAADGRRAVGLLLQRLPSEGGTAAPAHTDDDGWDRMNHLAATLTRAELLELPAQQVLHRLFWQEPLRALESRNCRFACRCTREKVAGMLRLLGRDEVESIVRERGDVDVACEYCNLSYRFDPVDCTSLFLPAAPGASELTH